MNLFRDIRSKLSDWVRPGILDDGTRIPMQSGQKSSAVGPIIAAWQALQPVWSGRNMEEYAKEGFRKNSIAYGCINKLARAAAYVPLNVMKAKTKLDWDDDKDDPLIALLAKPNPRMTQQQLFEALTGSICLWGNNALEMKPAGIDPSSVASPENPPNELFVHRFDLFRIVPAKDGTVYGYWYEENGQHFVWKVDPLSQTCNLLHMKTWHPTDRWYGMSPTEAAAMGIDQHNTASMWNQGLLQNGARPSGVITWKPPVPGAVLTHDQRADLRAEVDQMLDGARRKGRPMVLDGEWTYQEMGFSPKDMDWMNGKNVNAREICLCYGVPPYIMGIEDPTYNNITEARAIMYEDSVLPLLDFVLEHLNHSLCPLFGDDYKIVPDLNKVPALAVRRQMTWTMCQNANWLTTNEKREMTGFEPIEGDEADEVLIPSTLTTLSGINDPPPGYDENGAPLPDPNKQPGDDGSDDENAADDTKPPQGKPGAPPPGKVKPKAGKPSQAKFEKRLIRSILKRELGYDDTEAAEMAEFAYGEKERAKP